MVAGSLNISLILPCLSVFLPWLLLRPSPRMLKIDGLLSLSKLFLVPYVHYDVIDCFVGCFVIAGICPLKYSRKREE